MAEAQRAALAQALIGDDKRLMGLYMHNPWFRFRVDGWIEMFTDLVPALALRAEQEHLHYRDAREAYEALENRKHFVAGPFVPVSKEAENFRRD